MSEFDEKGFRAHLKKKELLPLYLIIGDEDYLKLHYTNELVKAVLGEDYDDFCFTRFEGKNTDLRDVFDQAIQLTLLSDKRVILVDDYKFDGLDEKELKRLEEGFSVLPDSTVLIFRQELVGISNRGSGKKALELFKKYGSVVTLSKRSGAALYDPLISSAKKQNCLLSRPVAEYFVAQVGDEFNILINELSKLCSYVGEGEITAADIDAVSIKTPETKIYLLTDHLLNGEFDRAYEVFDIMMKQKTEPEYMLGVIISAYVELYRVKTAIEAGYTQEEYRKKTGFRGKDFVLQKTFRRSRLFSLETIRRALDILDEADMKLKRNRDNPVIILEQLLVKLSLLKKS